jgi:hypothetical protein
MTILEPLGWVRHSDGLVVYPAYRRGDKLVADTGVFPSVTGKCDRRFVNEDTVPVLIAELVDIHAKHDLFVVFATEVRAFLFVRGVGASRLAETVYQEVTVKEPPVLRVVFSDEQWLVATTTRPWHVVLKGQSTPWSEAIPEVRLDGFTARDKWEAEVFEVIKHNLVNL